MAAAVLVVVPAASVWLLLNTPALTLINSLLTTAYLVLLVALTVAP